MVESRVMVGRCALLLAAGLFVGCARATTGTATSSKAPTAPIPAGALRDRHISYQFAIYYLPQPTSDPLTEVRRRLAERDAAFQQVDTISGQESTPAVAVRIEPNPLANYSPPDLQSLGYFGRGVSREQAENLQDTESALLLEFAYSSEHVWSGLRSAVLLTHSLAEVTGGLIWDESTREVFSPDAWKERRLDQWIEEYPDISTFTVIHAYKKDDSDFVRCISLGMEKFGVPDVVIDESSWSLNRNVGHIINLFAQTIAEGAAPRTDGQFDLDFRAIKNSKVRTTQLAALTKNATGTALLSLQQGTPEDGDPANRLIEIAFDRGIGPDKHAKQEQVIAAAFGWDDQVAQITHDEEIEAASRRARAKLPELRAAFEKGLAPGEFIQVKAPFDTPAGGREWMWVEVTSWNGDKITGLLKNEPRAIPTLHGGQMVEVSMSNVFDFIHTKSDGTSLGNETGKLIEQRQ